MTDKVYLFDKIEDKKTIIEFEPLQIKKQVIAELTDRYQNFYSIQFNLDIGNCTYDIFAFGPTPARLNTFWLIKCVKYKDYNITVLEDYIDELVRMKSNYEIISGKDIIAILYIVWDEEDEDEVIMQCKADFESIIKDNYQMENCECEAKLRIQMSNIFDEKITYAH